METEHFTLTFAIIAQAQADDKKLQETLNQFPMEYKQRIHHEQLIIFFKNKIVIPVKLQSRLIEWYHAQLLHPGVSRLIESMKQLFIGKQWLNIFQTSPRHAMNVKYSSDKENIMENLRPNFMISIHGTRYA